MEQPGEESIHSFRVEVKKLKALVHLFWWYFPDLDKKKLKKLWKLFDTAGAVREWQMLAARIPDSALTKEVSEAVLKVIHHEEKKAYRNFRRNHKKSGTSYIDETGEYLNDFTDRISKINLYGYFNCLTENIKSKWKLKKPANKTYHELRRDIKELKYNLKILDDDEGCEVHFFTNPEFLNECDELLGRWHDGVMASEQVQLLINKGRLTEDAKRELDRIRKLIVLEADQCLSKFTADYKARAT